LVTRFGFRDLPWHDDSGHFCGFNGAIAPASFGPSAMGVDPLAIFWIANGSELSGKKIPSRQVWLPAKSPHFLAVGSTSFPMLSIFSISG
jgi:hypothetical protein